MLQWLEFRTSSDRVKELYPHTGDLKLHYDTDADIVMFTNAKGATFSRDETVLILTQILKVLEDD